MCGTAPMDSANFVNQPWYGNNQYLLDLVDSIRYLPPIPKSTIVGGFDQQAAYWVPVKAWVYNQNDGTDGLSREEVETSIRTLNENFSGITNSTGNAHAHTMIQFYLNCNISYINSSEYTLDPSDNLVEEMFEENHTDAMLNIHYIQTSNDFGGRANFPQDNPPFSFTVVGTDHATSTMAHEAGHALGVAHPHRGVCWFGGDNGDCANCHQEPVSRVMIQPVGCGNFSGDKKCEVNGDGLCDTPGDPNLVGLVNAINVVDGIYEYSGTGQDNWNVTWTPDIHNIMSYSHRFARERFSPMQTGIMYFWALGFAPPIVLPLAHHLHIENNFVDIYEPDNQRHDDEQHVIDIGFSQHRGLHAERSGLKSNPSFGYCDEDWVRINIPANSNYSINISTDPVPDRPQVDTEIFLYDATGMNVLASNDDKISGNIYSEIGGFETAPGDYWIQVISEGTTSGEYYLTVTQCDEICCFQPLLGITTSINSLTGPFNIGARFDEWTEYVGNSLNVTNTLRFNGNNELGFGGFGFPLPSSELDAVICNNSEIVIGNLGHLEVGNSTSNRTANVTFTSGTKLVLGEFGLITIQAGSKLIIEDGAVLRLNGGTVRVFDGTEIIVKEGGYLVYEEGTTIELNGNDAQLALGGLTHVGNGATFTFTWQGAQNGYVRLLEEGYWGQRFSTGTNARFFLLGANKNDRILHLEPDAEVWDFIGAVDGQSFSSVGFEHIRIEKGTVIMNGNSRIITQCKALFMSVKFQGWSRGIQSYKHTQFRTCDLIRTPVDARLHQFNDGIISFLRCNLTNSRVDVRGMGFSFDLSHLDRSDIWSLETTVMNKFLNGTSTSAGAGIHDQSPSDLYVSKSRFENAETCIYKIGGTVTARCSEFLNSGYGIEAENRTVINLSGQNSGGYNLFEGMMTNIYLHGAKDLLLVKGFNTFNDGWFKNIDGQIAYAHSGSNPCPTMHAHQNIWTPANNSPNPWHPSLSKLPLITVSTNCLLTWNFGSAANSSSCPPSGGGGGGGPIDPENPSGKSNEISLMPKISTNNYFDSIYFDEAALMASMTTTWMDTLGDNSIAAEMMYELLMAEIPAVNDSIDALVESMRWNSLTLYKSIFETLVADEVVLKENNSANFEPIVDHYASTLMHFTDSVKTEVNYFAQFNLEVHKVALFKTLNKYDLALMILYNLNECEHDSVHTVILESQIAHVTFDLQMAQLGSDPFINDSMPNITDLDLFDVGPLTFIDSSGFGTYIINANSLAFSACYLPPNSQSQISGNGNMISQPATYEVYPNPTRGELTIGIKNMELTDDTEIIFTVTDIVGKEMFRQRMTNSTQQVNLPGLAPAPYMYYFTMNGIPAEQGRMIISK